MIFFIAWLHLPFGSTCFLFKLAEVISSILHLKWVDSYSIRKWMIP
uniref:Uncharacterized protein n=1 Tax=Arundo donax TaxID=35708 RepID=A0A0A9AC95_ARUDO